MTPFEVTFGDTGLFVQAWIYDMTSGSAVLSSKVAMAEVTTGSYVGVFTPAAATTYLIIKRVFTDGTYTTVDSAYSPSSEAIQSNSASSGDASTAGNILVSVETQAVLLLNVFDTSTVVKVEADDIKVVAQSNQVLL